jgi:riboflavin kinase / FMN adenylyltransferase
MTVHFDTTKLPAFTNAVITIGTFDGVHKGHQQLIQQMKAEAQRVGGESVIITFDPHPRNVIADGRGSIALLNTLEEKQALIARQGIHHLVVAAFTPAFAEQSPESYVRDFLVRQFHPHTIIIGYDHKFGRQRLGDYRLLETMGAALGFVVKEIPQHLLNDITISSTRIREALLKGDLDTTNELLGYPYAFTGKVIPGNRLGRTIGFPTANLQTATEKLIPANGVYAVRVTRQQGTVINGMMNIGVRPTVDGLHRVIEVNLFDFDQDIYGESLTITLVAHLRAEVKFSGLDALKAQLALDEATARKLLQ